MSEHVKRSQLPRRFRTARAVKAASNEELERLMGMCHAEPALPRECLACMAYMEIQEREKLIQAQQLRQDQEAQFKQLVEGSPTYEEMATLAWECFRRLSPEGREEVRSQIDDSARKAAHRESCEGTVYVGGPINPEEGEDPGMRVPCPECGPESRMIRVDSPGCKNCAFAKRAGVDPRRRVYVYCGLNDAGRLYFDGADPHPTGCPIVEHGVILTAGPRRPLVALQYGSPTDGFCLAGPFLNAEKAAEHAEDTREISNSSWWTPELEGRESE